MDGYKVTLVAEVESAAVDTNPARRKAAPAEKRG